MAFRSPFPPPIRAALAIALAATMAACTPSGDRANVEIRGSDPQNPAARPGTGTTDVARPSTGTDRPQPDANGVLTYDGYQSVLARDGETVAALAARIGMSGSELGAYNGLPPTHVLRSGDELVLPDRAPQQVAAATPQGTPLTAPAPRETLEQTPLAAPTAQPIPAPTAQPADAAPPAARPVGDLAGTPAPAPAEPATEAPVSAGQPQPRPADGPWDPNAIAAAIDRSTGLQQDGTLGAPPSANAPVPPEPTGRRPLESPDLGQYQTDASDPANNDDTAQDAPAPAEAEEQVAAADPAPAPATQRIRMRRPVKGPVAIGFNKDSGGQRNDGVDFAADAGAPVVAAADGEVALVSQSLGGLGTIVLVRHQGELLTVYGRVDGVSVQKGDVVRAGQKIGVVSDATAPAEPRMHFEVRRGAESLDPMTFLSQG